MICGDITNKNVFDELKVKSDNKIDFLIATPPCQGVSIAGKNKENKDMVTDPRNMLIFKVIEFIYLKNPDYILIENVPRYLSLNLIYQNDLINIKDILHKELSLKYNIEIDIMDASVLNVAQYRKRAIIRIYKKNLKWDPPTENKKITIRDSISHLPSLESGEHSKLKWHFARKHSDKHILWMQNTPTGKSAFENEIYYPKKENGEIIKGYNTTYRRMEWDKPAPTITMRNDAISSQKNVHPGTLLENGLYSDARVLTPLELMILSSIPKTLKIPDDTSEILIRQILGECVPPMMIKKIAEGII